MSSPLRIAIIAGEFSGDMLAAELMVALQNQYPGVIIEGVAGPQMVSAGCIVLARMEELQVMGLTEVLRHLPRLLKLRRQLLQHWIKNPPDIFIGVDYPEFNFSIEKILKKKGIKTVHYVSPSVWAWRPGRVKKIAEACDQLLAIFPFEAAYYAKTSLQVQYVGHSLADKPMQTDPELVLKIKNLEPKASHHKIVALLPGSRRSEWEKLTPLFIDTAFALHRADPHIIFVAPLVGEACMAYWKKYLQEHAATLPIHLQLGGAQAAMMASDAVLLASGTATLEALFCKKPMVVSYRMSALTYFFARYLVKLPYVSLSNILAGRELVPEYLQDHATVENLSAAVMHQLTLSSEDSKKLQETYEAIHAQLRCDASTKAAACILQGFAI